LITDFDASIAAGRSPVRIEQFERRISCCDVRWYCQVLIEAFTLGAAMSPSRPAKFRGHST
jgi:hypothetical protein